MRKKTPAIAAVLLMLAVAGDVFAAAPPPVPHGPACSGAVTGVLNSIQFTPYVSWDGIFNCEPTPFPVAWVRFSATTTEIVHVAGFTLDDAPLPTVLTIYPDFDCYTEPPAPIICAKPPSGVLDFPAVAGQTYLIRIQLGTPLITGDSAGFVGYVIDATVGSPTGTPTPTPTPTPTQTPVPPTDTPTLTPTASPTETPLPPTETPTPSPSPTPTETPIPPTASPTLTPTLTPAPTATASPTSSPVPSPTPVYGPGTYTVDFRALIREGGSVTETSETSGVGGAVSNIGTNGFPVGDTTSRQQTIGIASFDTSAIPPSATIDSASLSLWALSTKGNPGSLVPLKGDVQTGLFGSLAAAEAGDFEEAATAPDAVSFAATSATTATEPLSGAGLAAINKGGRTQVRLRFDADDNNNAVADRLELASGNCSTPLRRPLLTITFTVPGR